MSRRYLLKFTLMLLLLLSYFVHAQHNWTKLPQPYGGEIRALYAKGDTIFAGAGNTFYISTNAGTDWHYSGVESNLFFSCFIHTDANTYLASCYNGVYKSNDLWNWTLFDDTEYENLTRDSLGNIYAIRGSDALMSTDNLTTWKQIWRSFDHYLPMILAKDGYILITGKSVIHRQKNSGIISTEWEDIQMPYINPIRMASGPGNRIYTISDYPPLLGLTTDYGNTWEYTDLSQIFPGIGANYISVLDSTILLCGRKWDDTTWIYLYKSTDLGLTWETAVKGMPQRQGVWSITSSGKDFFAGTNGAGVFKSTDKGGNWFSSAVGMNESSMWNFVVSEGGHEIFASLWGIGTMRSTDQGFTWKSVNKGLDRANAGGLVMDRDGDLFTTNGNKIYRLPDHNIYRSWIKTAAPDPDWYSNLWVDPEGRVYARHTYGVLVSTDDGGTWNNFFNGEHVSGLFFAKEGRIFLTTSNTRRIYQSTDNGAHWIIKYQTTSSMSLLLGIEMDSRGYLYVPGYDCIIRSTNDGASWSKLQNGLSEYSILRLFADKNDNLYCSAQGNDYIYHLFKSTDSGENWELVTGNLNISVYAMHFQDDKIYLFTNNGLWINSPDITEVQDTGAAGGFILEQNYPNPFNPTTNIKYSITQSSFVSIKIYDILGKERAVLENEDKSAGTYEVTWNAEGLPSGIYFCRVKSNGFVITKKMMMVK